MKCTTAQGNFTKEVRISETSTNVPGRPERIIIYSNYQKYQKLINTYCLNQFTNAFSSNSPLTSFYP